MEEWEPSKNTQRQDAGLFGGTPALRENPDNLLLNPQLLREPESELSITTMIKTVVF